jgi:hypothetical protein
MENGKRFPAFGSGTVTGAPIPRFVTEKLRAVANATVRSNAFLPEILEGIIPTNKFTFLFVVS